jgi:catechol 2,3-dioxygenase
MNTSDAFFRSVEFAELTLRVSDLARVADFYERELGFHRITSDAHRARFSPTGAEPALIAIEHAPTAAARPRGAAGLFHVAFLYPNRTALARIFTRLVANGFRLGAADHGVSEALYLSDPEGNGLELYVDRPVGEWPPSGTDGQVAMYTEALDATSLMAAVTPTFGPLMAPETRIGHIHLSVSALDRAEAFYRDVLGFPVRQRDYPGARFFGRDGYHHHFGTNTWQTRTPSVDGTLGLARFTVRFTVDAERRHVLDLASDAGRLRRTGDASAVLDDFDGLEVVIEGARASVGVTV